MSELFVYLRKMGGLHDAIVDSLSWLPSESKIEFRFRDINANFSGLPGDPGRLPGVITLYGTTRVRMDIDLRGAPLRVFEFLPVEGTESTVLATFSPEGQVEIEFERADFPP